MKFLTEDLKYRICSQKLMLSLKNFKVMLKGNDKTYSLSIYSQTNNYIGNVYRDNFSEWLKMSIPTFSPEAQEELQEICSFGKEIDNYLQRINEMSIYK